MRQLKRTLVLASFLGLLGAAGCNVLEPEIADSGVVKKIEIEGGCWVIETNEETYLPANFPIDMRVHGLRVQFEAAARPDLASFCPGIQIDLIWMEALPADGAGT